MEIENVETPQKTKASFCRSIKQKSKGLIQANTTPRGAASSMAILVSTTATTSTPPAKRFQKVRNPFEANWADRLHLPVIASPSLFHVHRPTTPQLSSTQFEWTIDEVSVLQPADVEPHETQFHDSPDPEFESKAQLAISSYFKEQQIVPSPANCPLRNQRIILSEINSNTPISKPGRRIRDCETQTELTLPPVLPKELEEALRPFFKPHLSGMGQELNANNHRPSLDTANNSMRRKLFDKHNIILLEGDDKPKNNTFIGSSPRAPKQQTTIVGKLSDSLDRSSFGSLSPISNLDELSPYSPTDSATKRKTRKPNFEEGEILSPIQPPQRIHSGSLDIAKSTYRCDKSKISELSDITVGGNEDLTKENFTPDRSSSPMQALEFSTDSSINQRVSRLRVNSSHRISSLVSKQTVTEENLFTSMYDETQEAIDEDDLQLSSNSFNCSSSNSDTPRGKRRSANRKNLSQSFNANLMESEGDECTEEMELSLPVKTAPIQVQESSTVNFHRTDSGFNETSSTIAFSQEQCQPSMLTDIS